MYKKILVPLDGSLRAEAILPHVEHLALHFRSTVILLSMDDTADLLLEKDEVVDVDTVLEARHKRHQKTQTYLQTIADKWRSIDIIARVIIERGNVVSGIIAVARREAVDLVAMASHGQGGTNRTFYGSVAVGVLNQIDRPLLLIRSRLEE
ncbi:UspA domain-containing protein [Desulfosarcina cetonica]|uniref:universal stress protein n=1 Tax=Desulfosarcina cetonica TaxID=90730 RepID=UPI0006D0A859|nr:universal stress protein [Desulfosarcina cetonica]VTR65590.1 UspA domain-containing protein [Desulfosarcina cetonica]